MTPLQLDILNHYFISGSLQYLFELNTTKIKQANELADEGLLLKHADGSYEITDKGRFWMKTVLDIPYPTIIYRIIRETKDFK